MLVHIVAKADRAEQRGPAKGRRQALGTAIYYDAASAKAWGSKGHFIRSARRNLRHADNSIGGL